MIEKRYSRFLLEAKLEDDDNDYEDDEEFQPAIPIEKIQKQQRCIKQMGKLTKVS